MLDLRPIMIEIGDQVAVIGKVAERLPESRGKITIIEESQLETAQTSRRSCAPSPTGCGSSRSPSPRSRSGWRGAPQARAACPRDRRARRRAADAGCAPLRRRLLRRPTRQGRRGQARGPGGLEHPHADPRRPRLGVDHPRRRHARSESGSSARLVVRADARRAARPVLEKRLTTYAVAAGACSCSHWSLRPSPGAGCRRWFCSSSSSAVWR